ncbi:ATP-binding cassette domain-containing protein [Ferrimonas sediminicola]|uniref:ATP-binding cassette domain-containing protein n=1 Tax=Ferrimonas sediminicola TaxID=2569538 RepID=A0A4U1BCJ5_9GAMM|nr:energy-coupling factor ABC transporter ATP-binding protein [Ferrimonas sediminicola]TKB48620.1 ATP-binding cassette domain-containing protein [Ferrimonas sediminicola]
MSHPLIQLRDLAFGYGERPVFQGVNLTLNPGERLALVGGNGAGKSTLLQLVVGLRRPRRGEVLAFGEPCRDEADFHRMRSQVGLLFQDSDDQLFCPTVLEDVAFGPLNQGMSQQAASDLARETLASLGLEAFAERITHRLSGGEKRLVALASVLAMRPRVLLLDEPTNGLDEQAQTRLLERLQGLELAMILVSHDKSVIEKLANRAVILQDGELLEAVMHSHPHQHTHSHLHIHPKRDLESDHSHPNPAHNDHHNTGD